MYFIFQVCTVDKKLSIYFIFSFYLVTFSFFKKCGQADNFWKFWRINGNRMCFIIQKCGNVGKKLFFLFYFLSTLYPLKVFLHKVWTGGQAIIILKILMTTICISLLKSISCFLSFLYSLNFLQKVWTSGQALKKNQSYVFHY